MSGGRRGGALSPREVWAMPGILAALSGIGLVSALLADGPGDWLSWLALAAPVLVITICLGRRER